MLATNEEELCMAPPDSTENPADSPKVHPAANKSNHAPSCSNTLAPGRPHARSALAQLASRWGNREVRRDRPTGSAVGDFA